MYFDINRIVVSLETQKCINLLQTVATFLFGWGGFYGQFIDENLERLMLQLMFTQSTKSCSRAQKAHCVLLSKDEIHLKLTQ